MQARSSEPATALCSTAVGRHIYHPSKWAFNSSGLCCFSPCVLFPKKYEKLFVPNLNSMWNCMALGVGRHLSLLYWTKTHIYFLQNSLNFNYHASSAYTLNRHENLFLLSYMQSFIIGHIINDELNRYLYRALYFVVRSILENVTRLYRRRPMCFTITCHGCTVRFTPGRSEKPVLKCQSFTVLDIS